LFVSKEFKIDWLCVKAHVPAGAVQPAVAP